MCMCSGYWIRQMAAGFEPGPVPGYWIRKKPTVVEIKPEPNPEPKAEVSGGTVPNSVPGFGFGVCQLAGCIAILLVICSCFSGCLTI